jgi:hypothetical protein
MVSPRSTLRALVAGRTLVALLALVLVTVLGISSTAGAEEIAEGHYGSNKERAEGSIPSLGCKIMGYAAYTRKNGFPPKVLILGTSRGMMLDPREVKKYAGVSAFNASVSDGAARELLAMGSFAGLLTPGREPHLVIMFDIEGLDRRTPTKRVTSTIEAEAKARKACHKASKCAKAWRKAANAIVRSSTVGHEGRPDLSLLQRPDGMIRSPHLARLEREGADFAAMRAHRIDVRVNSYKPGHGFDKLMPIPKASAEELIKLANAWGDTPTILITAMHPDCIRICGPAGWSAHHREALAWFAKLSRTRDFDLHDFSDARSFGGSAASFYEEIHLRAEAATMVVKKVQSFGGWTVDPRGTGNAPTTKPEAIAKEARIAPASDAVDSAEAAAPRGQSVSDALAAPRTPSFLERGINQLHAVTRSI